MRTLGCWSDGRRHSWLAAMVIAALLSASPCALCANEDNAEPSSAVTALEERLVKLKAEIKSLHTQLDSSLRRLSELHLAGSRHPTLPAKQVKENEAESKRLARTVFTIENELRSAENKLRAVEKKLAKALARAERTKVARKSKSQTDPIDVWLEQKQAEGKDKDVVQASAVPSPQPDPLAQAENTPRPTQPAPAGLTELPSQAPVVAESSSQPSKSEIKKAEKAKARAAAAEAKARRKLDRDQRRTAGNEAKRRAKEKTGRQEHNDQRQDQDAEKTQALAREEDERATEAQIRAEKRAQRKRDLAYVYPWRVSLGLGYRTFDDIDFTGVAFRNFGANTTGIVSNGPDSDPTNGGPVNGPYGVQNVQSRLIPAATNPPVPNTTPYPSTREGAKLNPNAGLGEEGPFFITLDSIRYESDSEDVDGSDSGSLQLGLDRYLTFMDRWLIYLTTDLHFYNIDFSNVHSNANDPGAFTPLQFTHQVVDADDDPLDGRIIEHINPSVAAPIAGSSPGTSYSVRNQFDMDLTVIDAGIKFTLEPRDLNVSLAVGPTLSFVDASVTQRQIASWAVPGPDPHQRGLDPHSASPTVPAGSTSMTARDSDQFVALGLYLSLDLIYEFSYRWGVQGSIRYDYVGDEVDTSLAELDLSGAGGQLQLFYKF